MEDLKPKILHCLYQKLECYNKLIKHLRGDDVSVVDAIISKEQEQYNSLRKIFETSQCTVNEEAFSDIERITDALAQSEKEQIHVSDYLHCAMQIEKIHYRMFRLMAKHNANRLTAAIFENFAKELASHKLQLEQLQDRGM